jgi:hypothetical protein
VHEAHVALWILDGTQALKDSERRVLARIADVGTPVQVLVNKCDRLGQTKDEVVAHVEEGFLSIGLTSMGRVLGFSARLALAGRLGDEDAMQRSAWDEVEALLSDAIVDRSDELRSRALLRKALGIATELEALGKERQEAFAPYGHEEMRTLRSQASRLLSLDRTGCERVVQRLQGVSERVKDDLRPLRVAGMKADDVNASAYAEARVLVRMAGPLASALVEVAGLDGGVEPLVREAVASVLRGAAAGVGDLDQLTRFPSWRVVRACAMAAHDRVLVQGEQEGATAPGDARWLRLAAVGLALGAVMGG